MKLKNLLLSSVFALTASTSVAQTDAANYFDGKPFGWATCTDNTGSAYNLNGGYGYGEPMTTTITATGTDEDATIIKNAVKTYDVVILDGSKGDFVINGQIKFEKSKNKTIVGINNATLRTKFYLTDDILAALQAANLDKYSSTKQHTGTLPSGETVTCDERAFYTKKTMMEVTGDNTLSCRNAGIFHFNATDENIIIRNLKFVGPGSVDIDGVDLISQYGANYMWIDHCEFVDGMDGALDSGKRAGSDMFVTYSWNKFYYTSRSFSHSYTNGVGWMTAPDTQYITYANCWWADGCGRRLPQVSCANAHLLNNYYSCKGNDATIIINENTKAFIEGNYAETYIKAPLTFGSTLGSDIFYTLRDNYFPSASNSAYRTDASNITPALTVPYNYSSIPSSQLPDIIKAKHGAGATLDNDNAMPVVDANPRPSTVTTLYTYSVDAVAVNGYSTIIYPDGARLTLTARTDKALSAGAKLTIDDEQVKAIKLSNGAQNTFYAPEGKTITSVKFSSYINIADSNLDFTKYPELGHRNSFWKEIGGNTFNYTTCQLTSRDVNNLDTFTCPLNGVSEFTFTNSGEQLGFIMEVTYSNVSSAISTPTTQPQRSSYSYNLQGQRVNANAKGIVIRNGVKYYNK